MKDRSMCNLPKILIHRTQAQKIGYQAGYLARISILLTDEDAVRVTADVGGVRAAQAVIVIIIVRIKAAVLLSITVILNLKKTS